jgi:hypothetical protein
MIKTCTIYNVIGDDCEMAFKRLSDAKKYLNDNGHFTAIEKLTVVKPTLDHMIQWLNTDHVIQGHVLASEIVTERKAVA